MSKNPWADGLDTFRARYSAKRLATKPTLKPYNWRKDYDSNFVYEIDKKFNYEATKRDAEINELIKWRAADVKG